MVLYYHSEIYLLERKLSLGAISKQENLNQAPVSNKAFYYDLLKELEQTPLNIESNGFFLKVSLLIFIVEDNQILHVVNKSDKIDQVTFAIVQKKLGYKYSRKIYLKRIIKGH